jgi:hypothetical protein
MPRIHWVYYEEEHEDEKRREKEKKKFYFQIRRPLSPQQTGEHRDWGSNTLEQACSGRHD